MVVCAVEGLRVVTECLRSVGHDYECVIHISKHVGRYAVYLTQWCLYHKADVLL